MSETDAEFVDDMEWLHSHDREAALPPEKLNRLFALARRGAAMQWRPIETAPKDGTEFQAWVTYNGDRRWLEHRCRLNPETEAFEIWTRVDYDMDDWEGGYIATHWLPFPPPPALGEPDHAEATAALAEYNEKGGTSLEQLKAELGEQEHE